MIRRVLIFFLMLTGNLFLTACEKDINIKLDPTTTELVVDGSIEYGQYPVVTLSKSLDYFSKLDPQVLTESFIHNATVTIANDSVTGELQEDSLKNDSTGLMLYYYTVHNYYPGPKIRGQLNTTYTLTIQWLGQTYTASTSIPGLDKFIDSLWWEPAPAGVDSGLVNVKARITDPPGFGNYTRYFTKVNLDPFYPGLNSVYDDQITDGTTYTVIVDKGVNRNFPIDFKTYSFFSRGDSILVKLSNIDQGTYNFWRTMEYNYQSIGNPFSTPTTVISNFSNGALGYFGGYASQYRGLLIPY